MLLIPEWTVDTRDSNDKSNYPAQIDELINACFPTTEHRDRGENIFNYN
jgi:hypothetical protein